jgi:hypothetical protein
VPSLVGGLVPGSLRSGGGGNLVGYFFKERDY